MQLVEVKYLSDASLEGISAEATKLIQSKDAHWELFGDVKYLNGVYVQGLVRIDTPEVKE